MFRIASAGAGQEQCLDWCKYEYKTVQVDAIVLGPVLPLVIVIDAIGERGCRCGESYSCLLRYHRYDFILDFRLDLGISLGLSRLVDDG